MLNAFTIDLEEHFQVVKFEPSIPIEKWEAWPSRVRSNTLRLLELLEEHDCKATFFTVGWVAERYPDLIREIVNCGHEIGCHSYWHRRIDRLTPAEFRTDLRQAKSVLEEVTGMTVDAFRAPSYSITDRCDWAWDVLVEEGFLIDSSIFPVYHLRYGNPKAHRFPHRMQRASGTLLEFPLSTVRIAGTNVPVLAGGYLRFFPYTISKYAIEKLNNVANEPAVVAVHPWELDPHQPIPRATYLRRFRHLVNIDSTEKKLRNLLKQFSFGTMKQTLKKHLVRDSTRVNLSTYMGA